MKTFSLFVLIVAVVWAVFNRERIYVRDPMAKVYRNDAKQSGVAVYINASNDILLEQDLGGGKVARTILQHWNKMPGAPQSLACLRWMVCLADDDHAAVLSPLSAGKSAYDPHVTINGRTIGFVDTTGVHVRVEL